MLIPRKQNLVLVSVATEEKRQEKSNTRALGETRTHDPPSSSSDAPATGLQR